jgi:hypothetical protein
MATKAEKQAAKAEKQAEKAEIAQVKAAQKAETTLLKSQGASKDIIKAETKANKTELAQAKATLAAPGKQTVTPAGQATFLSQPSAYSGTLATSVQQALNNAAAKYGTLGITNASVSGDTKVGLGIDKLVAYDLGKAGSSATKTIERAQQFVGKSFTPDELAAQGVKIKPVKGADGLFQYKTGEPGNNVYTFFRQDANGNLVGTGVNRTSTPKDDGGFFQSGLGQALMIAGSIALALTPGGQAFAASVGSALSGGALSGAAAQALGQAAIRGVSTGAITGDFEKGLIAAAVSGAGSALNLSGELGNIMDSTGLGEFKDTFGVIGGNVSEASFAAADAAQLAAQGIGAEQIASTLVQQGGLSLEAAINAANLAVQGASAADIASTIQNSRGTGAFDVGGAEGTGLLDGVSDGMAVDAGAADVTQIAGEGATEFADGLSYDPGEGYGTGTAGGMAGAEDLVGSAAGGTFGMGAGAGLLSGLSASQIASLARTGASIFGGGGAGGGVGGAAGGGFGGLGNLFGNIDLGNLAGTAVDYAALQAISNEAQGLGQQLGREAAQVGIQNQTPFTPYTLTTGAGTATVGPGAATATAAAPYEALRQQALTQAGQTLGAINPAQATQQFYSNLEALAAPTRQREQEALLGRLGSAGLLGIGRNLPTAGGGVRAVNPFQESLLAAQEQGRIQQALQAQQYGTSEAARQQALAQSLQTQAMGIDQQTMNQLTQARQLGLDERSLAQANANLRAQTALKGLELRAPYEQLGLLGQIQGINAVAGGARGLLGLPTQAGNVVSGGGGGFNLSGIFNSLLNQGMSAEQAADYVNSISSGLDISGASQGTQNLIDSLQEYGIF